MFRGPYNEQNLPGNLAGDRYWSDSAWLLMSSGMPGGEDAILQIVESAGRRADLIMCEKALSEGVGPEFTKILFSLYASAPRILLANISIINAACIAGSADKDGVRPIFEEATRDGRKLIAELNTICGKDVASELSRTLSRPILKSPANGDYFGLEMYDKESDELLCSLPLNVDYDNVQPEITRRDVRARWCEIALLMQAPALLVNLDTVLGIAASDSLWAKTQDIHQLTERHLEAVSSRPLSDFELFGVHHCDVCGAIGVWPVCRYRVRSEAGQRPIGFGAEFPVEVDDIPDAIPMDHDSLLDNKIITEIACPTCYRL